eukprot:851434_1
MLIKSSRTALHNLLSNSLRSLSSSSTPSASETPKERAFIDFKRQSDEYRAPLERLNDYDEIMQSPSEYRRQRQTQAARCMDCGTPFCQSYTGCPLYNLIPEWNDLVLNQSGHSVHVYELVNVRNTKYEIEYSATAH